MCIGKGGLCFLWGAVVRAQCFEYSLWGAVYGAQSMLSSLWVAVQVGQSMGCSLCCTIHGVTQMFTFCDMLFPFSFFVERWMEFPFFVDSWHTNLSKTII
jgi:hypothetical protein